MSRFFHVVHVLYKTIHTMSYCYCLLNTYREVTISFKSCTGKSINQIVDILVDDQLQPPGLGYCFPASKNSTNQTAELHGHLFYFSQFDCIIKDDID